MPPEPARLPLRRAWRIVSLVLTLALAVGWFLVLRPQALGGPAEYVLVSGESMLPGLKDGDLVVVRRERSYGVGDVVAYRVPQGDASAGAQVIHRIVGGSERRGFVVQGDNRTAPDLWRPRSRDMIGTLWLRVPHATPVLQVLRSPLLLACLAAALAFVFVLPGGRRPSA
jgi:signal peptidase